ncbi:MAG: CPBP family intramembrane glutamic endopeptidase [Candidatus Comchoanobacterales bacterium]
MNNTQSIKWYHWILTLLIFTASLMLEPWVFPSLNIGLDTNQQDIEGLARQKLNHIAPHWEPQEHSINLINQSEKQYYLEKSLSAQQLQQHLTDKTVYWHTWQARYFTPNDREITLEFHPDGTFLGFNDQYVSAEPSQSLSQEDARKIAQSAISELLNITDLKLISTESEGQETITHTLIFKPTVQPLNTEGYSNIIATISGPKLSAIKQGFHIPSAFKQSIKSQQLIKQRIQKLGILASVVLLSIGVLACINVYRRSYLALRQSYYFALFWSLINILYALNLTPLTWSNLSLYDSTQQFYIQIILSLMGIGAMGFITGLIGYALAETLYRATFTGQLSIPSLLKVKFMNTPEARYGIHQGYALCGLMFGFISVYYLLGVHIFGFYLPSRIAVNFDILNTSFPWLIALTHALQASFSEEVLYRVIPISAAILWTHRKHPYVHIAIVIQAFVWAVMHVGYPTEPFYVRIIELTLVGLFFGYTYLRHGIIPVILMHFLFNFILMSTPLFYASGWLNHFHQVCVIVIILLPLALTLRRSHITIEKTDRNPPLKLETSHSPALPLPWLSRYRSPIRPWSTAIIFISALISIILIYESTQKPKPPRITQHEAAQIARTQFETITQHDADDWYVLPAHLQASDFSYHVYQRPESLPYFFIQHQLNHPHAVAPYLYPDGWHVMIRSFNQDTPSANNTYFEAFVSDQGTLFDWQYTIPDTTVIEPTSLEYVEQQLIDYLNHQGIDDWSWFQKSVNQLKGHHQYQLVVTNNQAKEGDYQGIDGITFSGKQHSANVKHLLIAKTQAEIYQPYAFTQLMLTILKSASVTIVFLIPVLLGVIAVIKKRLTWSKITPYWLIITICQVMGAFNLAPIWLRQLQTQANPWIDLPINLLFSLWQPILLSLAQAITIAWCLQHTRRISAATHGQLVSLSLVGIGLLFVILQPAHDLMAPLSTQLPYVLSSVFPVLGTLTTVIPSTLMALALSLIINQWAQLRSGHLYLVALLILCLLYPQLYSLTYDVNLSMATSLMVAALACLFIGCFTRYDEKLVLLIVLIYLSLPHLTHLSSSLWPHATLALVAIWVTGLMFFQQAFSSAKKVMTEVC